MARHYWHSIVIVSFLWIYIMLQSGQLKVPTREEEEEAETE